MKRVSADEKTTLLLNYAWQPITVIPARAAFTYTLNGKVIALDTKGNSYTSMNQWMAYGQDHLDPEQPVLCSQNAVWPIPTIVAVTSKFYHKRTKKKLALGDLAKVYGNICQYCLKKYPIAQLTIDHIKPRSLGGSDEHVNRTLACRKCNCNKSSHYPYFNVNNESVSAPSMPDIIVGKQDMRPEWKMFLQSHE
jgi:hypothetical protein